MTAVNSEPTCYHERAALGTESWRQAHAEHLARYLRASELVRGKHVLDAGTGPGYGAAMLKLAGALSVQAIDIDAPTIERARRSYEIDGLIFQVDDCEVLANVQQPIEVVCNFENIEHLHHPERFLEAAVRLLPNDGVLLCSTPDKAISQDDWADGKPSNPYHMQEWTAQEFSELLSRYFASVELFSQVLSHAFLSRRQAAENLNKQLAYLWSIPLLRLARAAGKIVGRRREWPSTLGLASASPSDFPIVPSELTAAFGEPYCHYAICREPRR